MSEHLPERPTSDRIKQVLVQNGVDIALLGTLASTRDRVLAVIDGEGE